MMSKIGQDTSSGISSTRMIDGSICTIIMRCYLCIFYIINSSTQEVHNTISELVLHFWQVPVLSLSRKKKSGDCYQVKAIDM